MESVRVRAFFSRPFDPRVAETVEYIKAICRGLDIEPICLDGAGTESPADEAKNLIETADFFIGFCPKSDKLEGKNQYITSRAVRDEVTLAKAFNKPIICFLEDGVKADGFLQSTTSYKILEDTESLTSKDFESIIHGIHKGKLRSLTGSPAILGLQDSKTFNIANMNVRFKLKKTEKGLLWDYVFELEYDFDQDHPQPLKHTAFSIEDAPVDSNPPLWKVSYTRNGMAEHPEISAIEKANIVDIKSTFSPPLKKGDKLIVKQHYQSPYLGAVHKEQNTCFDVRGKKGRLDGTEGLCIINRVQRLKISFVFPEGYLVENIQPLVTTFSNTLDDPIDREIERIINEKLWEVEQFDGETTVVMNLDRPLYQCFYGVGWILPSFEGTDLKIVKDHVDWL